MMLTGVIASFLCVLVALNLEGGNLRAFVSLPAFVIVAGGSLGAALVSFRPSQLRAFWKAWKGSQNLHERIQAMSPRLARYSGIVRHKGVLHLDPETRREPEPLLRLGLQQLIDGASPEEALASMERKLSGEMQQLAVGERFLESIGGYSPTFGIIGTVMALVAVLSELNQPERLAAGIAAAFVATFYGVLLANLVALPLACRVREHAQEYLEFLDNLFLGLQLVYRGEAPLTLVERLSHGSDKGKKPTEGGSNAKKPKKYSQEDRGNNLYRIASRL